MAYKIVEWEMDTNNKNQRWVSGEMGLGCFLLFVACIAVATFSVFQGIAFKKHSNKCFQFWGCMNMLATILMFLTYIGLSMSRWSEAGRACSGEFWDKPEQNFSLTGGFNWNTFADSCVEELGGCKIDGIPVAPTIHTGIFVQVMCIIFWAGVGCMCMCCMCAMMMMMCMKKKMMEKCQADKDMRGQQVNNTEMTTT